MLEATTAQAEEILAGLNAAPAALEAHHIKLSFPSRPASMNGFTHGLTGQNVLLNISEFTHYMRIGFEFMQELRPVGIRETKLAQRIIDGNWRLGRIPALEQNLFSSGPDETPSGYSQAAAFRSDCAGPNAFEKLSRSEFRIHKIQLQLEAEMDRLQENRRRREGKAKFAAAGNESDALQWYARMATLAREIEQKSHKNAGSKPVTVSLETTSEPISLSQKPFAKDPEPALETHFIPEQDAASRLKARAA